MSRLTDYNARMLRRRLEVVRLPVSVLRRHAYLIPSEHEVEWEREPIAVGIGPYGDALAVWPSRSQSDRMLVTRHNGGREVTDHVVISGAERGRFIQPLPGDRLLLACTRSYPDGGAQTWSSCGELIATAHLGDAIKHLLTTPTGTVWVGYFDEAMVGSGPQTRGLARFDASLNVDWLYPRDADLPVIFDCYALNVTAESAVLCAYRDYHVQTVTGSVVADHGLSPQRGAGALLLDGAGGALVGGYGAEYDLITPFRLGNTGVEAVAERRRLVQPDGMEVRSARYFCRGANLHVIIGSAWYRLDLSQVE